MHVFNNFKILFIAVIVGCGLILSSRFIMIAKLRFATLLTCQSVGLLFRVRTHTRRSLLREPLNDPFGDLSLHSSYDETACLSFSLLGKVSNRK